MNWCIFKDPPVSCILLAQWLHPGVLHKMFQVKIILLILKFLSLNSLNLVKIVRKN